MHVFSFLSKKELIKIERVCKQWKECSIRMWRSIKHLNFAWLNLKRDAKLTSDIIIQVTERCGQNLQILDIGRQAKKLDESALNALAENCPNLQSLNVIGCNLNNKLNCLNGIASNLQRIIFNSCCLTNKDLNEFFPQCTELISVSLEDNRRLTSTILSKLNTKLEELTIDSCWQICRPSMVKNISKLKCLRKLSINNFEHEILQNGMFYEIFKNLPQLETLSMNSYYRGKMTLGYNGYTSISAVSLLTGLVTLSLRDNDAVNDDVLHAISENCKKIESLDISGCSIADDDFVTQTVTDVGIEYVARLPKLVDLTMCGMEEITDQALVSLADRGRLKKLECRNCPTLTDFGFCRLVSMCDELERFDISGSNCVRLITVLAASASMKVRTNNVALTLVIGEDNGIYKDLVPDIDPLLRLDITLW